jgi:alpha-glucosidase
MPVMRPLLLHYPEDEQAWTIDNEYLFGADLLVAPVIVEGARERTVHFPGDVWLDFWTGEPIWESRLAGDLIVKAPMGKPPVFVRADSPWKDLLRSVSNLVP